MRYLDFNVKSMIQYTHSQPRISRKGFSMLKRSILLGLAALLVAAMSSCIFSPDEKGGEPPKPPKEKLPLTSKSAVLNNIEYAYNKRDLTTYQDLLDNNFTFFYTESDANGTTPVQWGSADEITTTHGIFDHASSIDMDLVWEDGVQWSEQISGSETWYYTTVFYHFTIKIDDTTFIPNAGSKAQFTVRNAGTAAAPHWQLVEFRDLGGPS
jgi:hypothetical protein